MRIIFYTFFAALLMTRTVDAQVESRNQQDEEALQRPIYCSPKPTPTNAFQCAGHIIAAGCPLYFTTKEHVLPFLEKTAKILESTIANGHDVYVPSYIQALQYFLGKINQCIQRTEEAQSK